MFRSRFNRLLNPIKIYDRNYENIQGTYNDIIQEFIKYTGDYLFKYLENSKKILYKNKNKFNDINNLFNYFTYNFINNIKFLFKFLEDKIFILSDNKKNYIISLLNFIINLNNYINNILYHKNINNDKYNILISGIETNILLKKLIEYLLKIDRLIYYDKYIENKKKENKFDNKALLFGYITNLDKETILSAHYNNNIEYSNISNIIHYIKLINEYIRIYVPSIPNSENTLEIYEKTKNISLINNDNIKIFIKMISNLLNTFIINSIKLLNIGKNFDILITEKHTQEYILINKLKLLFQFIESNINSSNTDNILTLLKYVLIFINNINELLYHYKQYMDLISGIEIIIYINNLIAYLTTKKQITVTIFEFTIKNRKEKTLNFIDTNAINYYIKAFYKEYYNFSFSDKKIKENEINNDLSSYETFIIDDIKYIITLKGGAEKYKKTNNKITIIYKKKQYTRNIYISERKKYIKINKIFMLLSKLKKT
jgi:hypothetical protein